jgi:hypothetical protein
MSSVYGKDESCVERRVEVFKVGYRREENVDVLLCGKEWCWPRGGAELEVDDAVLEEGLQDGGCGVADGGFVCEEGVDVFAEEGEEAIIMYKTWVFGFYI